MNKVNQTANSMVPLLLSLSLTACAVNGDGHRQVGGVGLEVDYEKIQKAKQQLNENAEKEAAKATLSEMASVDQKLGTIVVGEVGVLQRISEKEQEQLYELHVKNQHEIYNRRPSVDLTEFKSKIKATCSIEVFYIPGVMTRRSNAIIPAELIDQTGFPSFNGSYFLGSTGDLVVAKPDLDDIVMIEKVLCKKADSDFVECKKRYAKGVFDLQTGQEVNAEMKPKGNGVKINPVNYTRL